MEYALLIVGFLATLTAVVGKTFEKKESGKKKITVFGYIALFLALMTLVISIFSKRKTAQKSKEKNEQISRIDTTVTIANDSIQELMVEIDRLEDKVNVYQKVLAVVEDNQKNLEFIPQWKLASYYRIEPRGRRLIDGNFFSGTLLKFVGFDCSDLELRYDGRRERIPMASYPGQPFEFPIIGTSGRSFKCELINRGENSCGGKVYAMATPRVESDNWSWEGLKELTPNDIELLIGIYEGSLNSKKLVISIENIDGQVINGYNIAGENRRSIKGVVLKSSKGYKLILTEPGDDKWDGKFELVVNKHQTKLVGEGTWKSYNGDLKRTVRIEK